jgi:hypothetical protein
MVEVIEVIKMTEEWIETRRDPFDFGNSLDCVSKKIGFS